MLQSWTCCRPSPSRSRTLSMSTLPRASTASMHLASGQVNIRGKLLYMRSMALKMPGNFYAQFGIQNMWQVLYAAWHTKHAASFMRSMALKIRYKFYAQHGITNTRQVLCAAWLTCTRLLGQTARPACWPPCQAARSSTP